MTRIFADASPLLDDPTELRIAARREGFLFFRGYMDPEPLRRLRREVLEVLGRFSVLAEGGRPRDDVVADSWRQGCEDYYGSGVPAQIYKAVQQLEAFHALPHHPRLQRLQEHLVGGAVLVHPGIIGRLILPGGFATPPHQDIIHTKGSENTWTCWTPLGDVPRGLGPLSVLRGSHALGRYPVKPKAQGGMEAILPEGDLDWVEGDFRLGDLVVFSGFTVHKALPNRSLDRLRLSMDFRFQPLRDPVAPNVLEPHAKDQAWDNIYAGWRRRDHQYYWRRPEVRLATEPPHPETSGVVSAAT